MDLFEWFCNWKSTKCPRCSSSFKEVHTHRCTVKCFNIRPQMYSRQVCIRDVNAWICLILVYFKLLRFWGVVVVINLYDIKVEVLKGWHIFEDQFGSEHHSDSLYKKPIFVSIVFWNTAENKPWDYSKFMILYALFINIIFTNERNFSEFWSLNTIYK